MEIGFIFLAVNIIQIQNYQLKPVCIENVFIPCGMCPMSPSIRQLTFPVGRMVTYVREQLKVHSRNHASGGICRARVAVSISKREIDRFVQNVLVL